MSRTARVALLLLLALVAFGAWPASGQPGDKGKSPAGSALVDSIKARARFSHLLTLPTSEALESKLEVAPAYLKGGDWAAAVRVLQWVLDHPEDAFVAVKRPGPDGKDGVGWVSARGEARRLLGMLSPRALEIYEVAYGPRAADLLRAAKQHGDLLQIATVAQRYPHTAAGRQAADLLGTYHLDRGQHATAARCFARLLQGPDAGRLKPLTLFKAALAFRRAGDQTRADEAWKALSARAPQGVQFGDRLVGLGQLKKELALGGHLAGEATAAGDWLVFRGSAGRSGQSGGLAGGLRPRWQQPTIQQARARGWVEDALRQLQGRGQTPLPAAAPLGVGSAVVFRSHRGVQAVDRATGRLLWESPLEGSLESLADNGASAAHALGWVTAYLQNGPHVLLENSVVGTLSTDRQRVYAVEDLAIPPSPTNYNGYVSRAGANLRLEFAAEMTDAVYHSRLLALELDGGRVAWQVGGRGEKKDRPLNDTHFLGPPLPLGGKLYVLVEKEHTLRLVCLDAATGRLFWMQTLATPKNNVLLDGLRRTWAAHPAHAEGVLVCPTNAGALVAVDLASRSLLWAHAYRDEAPPVVAPLPGRFRPRIRPVLVRQTMNLNVKWKHCAPVIHGGKVLVASPDGGKLECLDLWTGALCWGLERRDEDLYLAGVFNDRVLIVGRQQCFAVSLAAGTPLWNLQTGTTSGLGVAAGKLYYLPVATCNQFAGQPAIQVIDTEKGVVASATALPREQPPGNLLIREGEVVSQTADRLAVYSPEK